MDEETTNGSPEKPISVQSPFLRNKTLRLTLASSLRRQAEQVAQNQGVSVNYLVTQAIEEKIARMTKGKAVRKGSSGVHLVVGARKTS